MRTLESDFASLRLLLMAALFLGLALFAETAVAQKPIDALIKIGGGFTVVNAAIWPAGRVPLLRPTRAG